MPDVFTSSFETLLMVTAIVVLLLLSGFFNLSETALTAASRARMHALEGEGNKKAGLVNRLLSAPEKLIGANPDFSLAFRHVVEAVRDQRIDPKDLLSRFPKPPKPPKLPKRKEKP